MNTVLGHYPAYLTLAARLGASYFNIPESRWNRLSSSQKWVANRLFLNSMIETGSQFVFANHPGAVRPGTWFHSELLYLRSRGVRILPTLDAYVP